MLPRTIELVHASPGRTRMRLEWLRREREEVERLADVLERLSGMEAVEIRPYTGSVLCLYDAGELGVEALLEAVRRETEAEWVVRPGEERPCEEEVALQEALRSGSGLAREASLFFKGLNVDVLRATNGHMDLPTLATLGFMTAGAVDVVATRKLPLPPWFNLAWWAFRTFTTMEKRAIRETEPPLRGSNGSRGTGVAESGRPAPEGS